MAVTLFEKKPVSDHIRIQEFPAAAQKGDFITIGLLTGFSDYDTASGEPGSIDIGEMKAVIQIAIADVAGADTDTATGAIIYITSAGAFTLTATNNTAFATIVKVDSTSLDFVKA
jgi:hypothetical protein